MGPGTDNHACKIVRQNSLVSFVFTDGFAFTLKMGLPKVKPLSELVAFLKV